MIENSFTRLLHEIFVEEERCQAELRLSLAEVEFLQSEYLALCRPTTKHMDSDEKRWYFVQIMSHP